MPWTREVLMEQLRVRVFGEFIAGSVRRGVTYVAWRSWTRTRGKGTVGAGAPVVGAFR
jgi:hypothetical protein